MEIINKNLIKTIGNKHSVSLEFTFFDMRRGTFEIKNIYFENFKNNGIFNFNIEINDYEQFLKYIFPDCKVENHEHYGSGSPDFKLIDKDGQIFYIEYKSPEDSLRMNQLAWMYSKQNHKKEIFILYIGAVNNNLNEDININNKTNAHKGFWDKPINL